MTTYTTSARWTEYDEDTEAFFSMRERDHELRSTLLQNQYRAHN